MVSGHHDVIGQCYVILNFPRFSIYCPCIHDPCLFEVGKFDFEVKNWSLRNENLLRNDSFFKLRINTPERGNFQAHKHCWTLKTKKFKYVIITCYVMIKNTFLAETGKNMQKIIFLFQNSYEKFKFRHFRA